MNRRKLLAPMLATAVWLAGPAQAQSGPGSIEARVEAFRQAQLASDPQALAELALPELSYSHSDGRVEDREKFVANATSGKSPFTALTYESPSINVVGPNAVVRFHWLGEQQVVAENRKSATNLHILMVWQKQGDTWKLLARSATKL